MFVVLVQQLGMALQKQLTEAETELTKRQKHLEATNKKYFGNIRKLNQNSATGLAESEENKVFAATSKKSFGAATMELDNKVIASYQDFVAVWTKLKETMNSTSAEYKKIENFYNKLIAAAEKRKLSIKSEVAEAKVSANVQNKAVQDQLKYMSELSATIQENNGWTEEEKKVYSELVDVLTRLVDARKQQANIQEQVKTAQKQQNEANKSAKNSTQQFTSEINSNTRAHEQNTSTVARAAKQVFTYGSVINLFRKIYRTAIQTVTDMDKALTDMAVVTSMNREQAYQLTGQLNDLAMSTGQTTSEIADITTKFLQQGKSMSQAMELTEAAARAATIAGISGSQSVDLLTNAMNGFQISASQAMEVSDKFAALAASAATDYEELATALSKVAAQANLAGLSMDFTLGLLTKGIETTREAPETIGTALKTVISRMRELSDYGKTLEDGVDVNRVDKALQNVGISLMDTNGQFRDLEAVLTELGGKWDELTVNQQANVAVALAGTRQQSRLIAMMQDFDRTLELVDTSANSYGATMAQSADYMEGLGAATSRLTSATQKLITDIADSEVIIGIVDILTEVVQFGNDIVNNVYVMVPLLALASMHLLNMLNYKLREKIAQADLNKLELQNKKLQIEQRKVAIQVRKEELKQLLNKIKQNEITKEQYKTELQSAKLDAEQTGNSKDAAKYAAELAALELENYTMKDVAIQAQLELNALESEENYLAEFLIVPNIPGILPKIPND